MIDDIKAEMTKKLVELAMEEPVTGYINMYYLALSCSDAARKAYIAEISDPLWCAHFAKNNFDRARLTLLKSYLLHLFEQRYHIAVSLLPVIKSFDILGQTDTASFVDIAMNKLRESDDFRREVYSGHNSRNASGRRNKHADEVIAIMSETWRHYPHTPKNAMIKKVYGHLKGKVSEETLARWIKEEKLGPVSVVRPCPPFRLIIPS
ncbi:hypothetical protein EKL29_22065 [Pantoea sp. YU22]|uniref:hypothetical protein n=1 Tax=Pantoea TaxID=53335 RepID=UPI000F89028A|nr:MULTISPECIES: hypothetical protein [Pantoea]RTY53072.1 hypothetical protein EKL29_22065 [Pantoea sp. YU22]